MKSESDLRIISQHNNLIRAERASQAIVAYDRYCEENPNYNNKECLAECIKDLFSDLRHLCELRGIDFDDMVCLSRNNYYGEKNFDGDEAAFCSCGGLTRGEALVDLPELVGKSNG